MELKDKIKQLVNAGKKPSEIRKTLFALGYNENEIDVLLNPLIQIKDAEDLYRLTGHAFEQFLKELFVKLGYTVFLTKITGDQGGDLIIERDNIKTVVQAKNFCGNAVGNKAIQEVFTAMSVYNCQKAMVVTSSHFTKSAEYLAEKNNIVLWDKNQLSKKIKSSGILWIPNEKYLKSQNVVQLVGEFIENTHFAIRSLNTVKQLSGVVANSVLSGEVKAGAVTGLGFEIKNISNSVWCVGGYKDIWMIDKNNAQHRELGISFHEPELADFSYIGTLHQINPNCTLKFNLYFQKQDTLIGIQYVIINIQYTTTQEYYSEHFIPKHLQFKIDVAK